MGVFVLWDVCLDLVSSWKLSRGMVEAGTPAGAAGVERRCTGGRGRWPQELEEGWGDGHPQHGNLRVNN